MLERLDLLGDEGGDGVVVRAVDVGFPGVFEVAAGELDGLCNRGRRGDAGFAQSVGASRFRAQGRGRVGEIQAVAAGLLAEEPRPDGESFPHGGERDEPAGRQQPVPFTQRGLDGHVEQTGGTEDQVERGIREVGQRCGVGLDQVDVRQARCGDRRLVARRRRR
nr:hypothetical protein [Saccharothrix deserti]